MVIGKLLRNRVRSTKAGSEIAVIICKMGRLFGWACGFPNGRKIRILWVGGSGDGKAGCWLGRSVI